MPDAKAEGMTWPDVKYRIASNGSSTTAASTSSLALGPASRHGGRNWDLTFDMSGRPQTAKLAVGCPLDGGVSCPRT